MAKATPEDRDVRDIEAEVRSSARLSGRRGGLQSPNEALQPLRPPPPPQRQKRRPRRPILSTLSGILSFLLVISLAAAVAVFYGTQMFAAPRPLAQDKIVFIAPGTGTAETVDRLEGE